MRYNRADIASTMRAAIKAATTQGKTLYVFATAYGFTIWPDTPPKGQSYYVARPDGSTELIVA